MQIAALTGIWGITFAITWFASTAEWAWSRHFEWNTVRGPLLTCLSVLGGLVLAGAVRVALAGTDASALRIATLNRPVDLFVPGEMTRITEGRVRADEVAQVKAKLTELHTWFLDGSRRESRAGARLIAWPEANLLVFREDEPAFLERAKRLAAEEKIYLAMGIASIQLGAALPFENKLVIVDPSGSVVVNYLKSHPVAGWEASIMKPGDGVLPVVATPVGRVASAICFDADFPAFMRQAGQGRADLMIVVANEWKAIKDLHVQMAAFRAIENGVPLIRPAASGISSAIDPWGRMLAVGDFFARGDRTMHLIREPKRADEVVRIFRKTLETGESYITPEPVELRLDGAKTGYYEWQLNRITQPDGRFALVCYFRDITEQRKASAAKAHLAAIIESADDAIIAKNLDGIIQSCNDAAERLFGYPAAELVGRNVRILIPPERQFEEDDILARLRRGERIEHFETIRIRKDGRPIEISLTVSPVRDESGRIVGASKIARDITGIKHAEAERMRILQENAAVMETLNSVGAIVASDLDQARVVQAVTDAATELTTAEFGAFFYNLVNEAGESYTLYTISGVPREAFSKFPMPRNTEVFEATFKGIGIVRSADITKDPRYGHNPPYHGMPPGHLPVRSYLAVPVKGRSGDVIGGLFFGHSAVGRFDEQHERLAAGIASWASVALENARMYMRAQTPAEIATLTFGFLLVILAVAVACWLLVSKTSSVTEERVFAIGGLLLLGGAAAYLSSSALFAGFAAGVLWRAAGSDVRDRIAQDLGYLQRPVVGLLLLVAGAKLHVSIALIGFITFYVLCRIAGKLAGRLLARRLVRHRPSDEPSPLSPGIVGLAFALNVVQVRGHDDIATTLFTIVVVGSFASDLASLLIREPDPAA